METTARVAWSRVGINLEIALRQAVRTVLRERALHKELVEHDGASRGAELLELLVTGL